MRRAFWRIVDWILVIYFPFGAFTALLIAFGAGVIVGRLRR